MTVRKRMHQYLTDNGLWDDEADMILESLIADPLTEVFQKEASDYPTVFFVAATMTVRYQALEWLDANKPMHFAQYMLDPDRMDKAKEAIQCEDQIQI